MSLTVRYVDAPPEAATQLSIYSRLVSVATGEPVQIINDVRARVDLELVSVHRTEIVRLSTTVMSVVPGRNYRRRLRRHERWTSAYREPSDRASHSIWFTGENVRPPGGPWDGYLSFELDPLDGRNAYFPHWWEYLGLWSSARTSYSGMYLDIETLQTPREAGRRRQGFACAFIGNPTPMRLHAINALSRVGSVEVFGNSVGRPVPSKAAIAKDFRFVLCFENDLYPGYVTEKPFEAWATGAVPLWWGDDPAGYVNEEAVVNAARFSSLSNFAESVAEIDADHAQWESKASARILLREPQVQPAVDLVAGLLGTLE